MAMAVELPNSQVLDQEYNHEASSLSLNKSENTTNTWSCFGSSDSGSVLSSTETETEESELEEDYMAELSRQMAHYMLQDYHQQEKVYHPSAYSQSLPKLQSKQALIDEQIRSIQYYKLNLKQDQPMKQQDKNKKIANIIDPQNSIQHMRAVSKTKSFGGTGVFLPQGISHVSDSRKKQGCSTVLIPARVVKALKQHFDRVGVPARFNGNFPLPNQNDGFMCLMKNNSSLNSQQQRPAPASNHPEIALPQEWTY